MGELRDSLDTYSVAMRRIHLQLAPPIIVPSGLGAAESIAETTDFFRTTARLELVLAVVCLVKRGRHQQRPFR